MPLPTFTIVMGVLTCVPFGLAIRETVKGVERPLSSEERMAREYEARWAEREARQAEWEAEEAKLAEERKAKHKTVVALLHGKDRATLGPAFDGATLGGPAAEASSLDDKLGRTRSQYELDITLLGDTTTFQSVFIKPTMRYDEANEFCAALEESLDAAWGDGAPDAHDRTIWRDETRQQRAIFDASDDCELKVEKYASLAAWFDKSKTAIVPLWAVGQPTSRIEHLLGDSAGSDDSDLWWSGLGIGNGIGTTNLRAVHTKGRIVAIVASVETDAITQDEVYQHISKVMGKEPDSESDLLVWKTRPRIELETSSSQLTLTIGTLPDEE